MDNWYIEHIQIEGDAYFGSTIYQTIYEVPPPTIKPLHQLRPPVTDFVGRVGEIEQLVQAICKATESGEVAIGGIRGLGGMGKTQLAYAVAQRLAETFPDAQLHLELRGTSDNPLTPEQALQTIIRAFEPLAQLPDNPGALRSIYLTLLKGKHVLILADDARDKGQIEELLPPPGCALLLTSRQRFTLPGMEISDIDTLSQLEAETLLLEVSPRIGSTASRTAQLCGWVPLALRLYASICASSAMSIEYHLKALEDERARLAHLRDPDAPNTNVEASLQLSYATLDPQVQKVLCQLSVFPSSFDIAAARAVVLMRQGEVQGTAIDHQPLDEMLDLLYRRSLLECDRQTGRYSLHYLVRIFGLGRVEGEEAARIRYAQHYALIAAQADNLYKKGGENVLLGLKLFDQERANIDAGWNWAQMQAKGQSNSISEAINALLLNYAFATAYVGDLRYNKHQERISRLEAAVGAARSLNHRGVESYALGYLGVAYAALGEIRKAIQYYEQGLEIARELGDLLSERNTLGNLGNAYRDLGETRKAIQYYEQGLEIARETRDHRNEGKTLGNLGIVYKNLGDTRKAIQYYEQGLEIAREIGDRRSQGNILGNLGVAYAVLGDRRKAIQYYEQNLEIAREIGDRRNEGNILGNLGIEYKNLGDTRKAIQYYEQGLEIARETGDRPSQGKALGNLGVAYAALGDRRKAMLYHEQNLEIAREIGSRQGEGIASWNLGALLAEEGNLTRAVELLQIRVAYEREIGHRDAEKHAATVEELRKRANRRSLRGLLTRWWWP